MPTRHAVQMTFEAGEISPLLFGRTDLEGYRKSATYIQNFIPNSRGSIAARQGFEYKQDVDSAGDTVGKLFTFRRDADTSYVIAVTPTEIWVADQDAVVESDDKMANGQFNNGTVNFSGGFAYLTAAAQINSSALIKQNVTGLSLTNTHKLTITSTASGGGIGENGDPGRIRVGTTEGASDILNVTTWDGSTKEYTFITGSASIWVEIEVNSVQYEWPPDTGFGYYGYTFNVDAIRLVDLVTATGTPVTFASPYSASQVPDIQAEMAPDLQKMVFVHREVSPRVLDLDQSTSPQTWSFNAITFSPVDPFGSSEYPGAVTFHQGRLWLASTTSKPATLFGSQPGRGNYFNFNLGTGLDDDSIEVTLAKNCDIAWIQGSKVLYVGADNSEHTIVSDGPVLTPSDISALQQSVHGSARVSNNWASETVAFITHDRRRLRLIDYDKDQAGVRTPDLAWGAEHMTSGKIAEVHHAPNPENLLWMPTQAGNLLSCTYDVEAGALAWARHDVPGVIKSATVVEEQGKSVVYILVFRDSDLKLCRLTDEEVYMDEFIQLGFGVATTSITGLDHLEGETVQVVADGTQRDDEVVSSGAITISGSAANEVIVGLPITRILETRLMDSVGSYGNSTAAFKKRWSEIWVRLNKSVIPKINGARATADIPDADTDVLADGTYYDHRVHNLGIDDTGIIQISEDLPFPTGIVSIFGRFTEEKL